MDYKPDKAVEYHYGHFLRKEIRYDFLSKSLWSNRCSCSFDQMLKNLQNTEFLLVALRNQEALLSSRIGGNISSTDEILRYEADYEGEDVQTAKTDVIETILYQGLYVFIS